MPTLNAAIGSTDQTLYNVASLVVSTAPSTAAVDLGNRLSATSTSGGPRHARASGLFLKMAYTIATTSSLTVHTQFSPDGGTTYYTDYEYTQAPLNVTTTSIWEVPFIAWCESHVRTNHVVTSATTGPIVITARLSGPRRVTV